MTRDAATIVTRIQSLRAFHLLAATLPVHMGRCIKEIPTTW